MREGPLSMDELADEITTLAAHVNAATCRLLVLIGEFDARAGWADWCCKSCAHWVAWRCSMGEQAARQYVRVARRLRELPLVCAAFASGELSYSKVRALTRVEHVEDESGLLDLARHSTAAQLERIVRAYRGVALADAERAHEERYVTLSYADDGSVLIRGRLPAEEGALVVKAIELARDRAYETGGDDSAESLASLGGDATVSVGQAVDEPTFGARTADALVDVAEQALAAEAAAARNGGDRFQVVVHVDAAALHGAEAGRAHVEDGGPLAAETARRLCCDAALVALTERDGEPLSIGRKTRAIPPALRRALRSRDGGCRFPGCEQHRWVDAHHIEHWANGGETSLDNLVQLCRHHRLLHEGGFTVERRPGGALAFRRPDGQRLRDVARRPRPGDVGCLTAEHTRRGLVMTPETPVPRWWGDRLDLGAAVDAVLYLAPPPAVTA